MGTERTKAGDQITFGKIKALQPKKVKHDKGTAGIPLFEQTQEDKNQINLFENNKRNSDNGK